MKRNVVVAVIVAMLLGTVIAGRAQDEKPASTPGQGNSNFYKLDFVVRELEDGKTVSTRNYTLMTRSNDWQNLRVGTRVPVPGGETKVTYTNVGLQVDCRVIEDRNSDAPALVTRAEITSVVEEKTMNGAPLIRNVQMNATSPVTIGKPVVISGVDELNSKHRFQLEVTVTKVK